MILARNSVDAPKKGFLDFLLGLFHHQTFRKSKKAEPVKANWWPTSPGLL